MKKKNKGIGRIIRLVGLFFDKWLITPITKLILKLMEIFKSWAKAFDRLSNKKSTLLVFSLILAFGSLYGTVEKGRYIYYWDLENEPKLIHTNDEYTNTV